MDSLLPTRENDSSSTAGTAADRREVIFAVGLIALEFAQLEEALDLCLNLLKSAHPTANELQKVRPHSGFKRKCDLFAEYGGPVLLSLELEPALAVDEIVKGLERLGKLRNLYVHSAASFYLSDGDHPNMRELTFRFREPDNSIDEVVVTNQMLTDMKALCTGITTTVWIMHNLLVQMQQRQRWNRELERISVLSS